MLAHMLLVIVRRLMCRACLLCSNVVAAQTPTFTGGYQAEQTPGRPGRKGISLWHTALLRYLLRSVKQAHSTTIIQPFCEGHRASICAEACMAATCNCMVQGLCMLPDDRCLLLFSASVLQV
jgi:hypothetical protein